MRKTMRNIIALTLSIVMVLAMGIPAFAAETNVISSNVELIPVDGGKFKAEAFVRNYTDDTQAILVLAVYDAEGVLVEAKSAAGINSVLTTEEVAYETGNVLRAYVWEEASGKVISNIANYDITDEKFNEILNGLSITVVDGSLEKTFAEYIGTAFDPATLTYTKNFGKGDFVIPEYKAESSVKDNMINVKVGSDSDTRKTEIIVEYGAEVKTETSYKYGMNNVIYDSEKGKHATYSKTHSKTYTINYTVEGEDPNAIYETDLTIGTISNQYNKTTGGKEYKKTYTAGTAEVPEKITIPFSAWSNQKMTVVIKTKDGTGATKPEDIENSLVVKADGTRGEVIDDKNATTGANRTMVVDTKYVDDDYTREVKEYGKAIKDMATLTKSDGTTAGLPICNKFMASNHDGNPYLTGSGLVIDRDPWTSKGMSVYEYTDENLTGGLYIPTISGAEGKKIEFYVNAPVDVYVLSCTSLTFYTLDDAGNPTSTVDTSWSQVTGESWTAAYQNANITDLAGAYLIKKGYIKEGDLAQSSANAYRLHRYNVPTNVMKVTLIAEKESLITSKTYSQILEIMDLDYVASTISGNYKNIISEVEGIGEGVNKMPVIRNFDVTMVDVANVNSYRAFSDRPAASMPEIGLINNYKGALDLYGAIHITSAVGWINDSGHGYATDYRTKKTPFYSFKAKAPVEIIVISNEGHYSDNYEDAEEKAKWKNFESKDALITTKTNSNGNANVGWAEGGPTPYRNMSLRKLNAGETFTFMTPGNGTWYMVFVKPLQ